MQHSGILHIINSQMPGPVMPVDMAMQLYIAHSPPLRSFLSSYEDYRSRKLVNTRYKPLRPCLSAKAPLEPPCLGWQTPKGKTKKRVAFADSKGMSLTAVHIFSVGDDESSVSQLQFDLTELEGATATLRINSVQSRVLDFPQPAADYLDFRSRLLKNSVCLENCTLQERSLTGTIKVRNLAFEKSVHVRITFDTWKSYQDVECTFMNNVYGCQDTDTFSFVIELPSYVSSQNKVQFCICYKTGGQTFWDNNDNRNYGLVPSPWNQDNDWNSSTQWKKCNQPNKQGRKSEMEFDQFGSPRTSSGLFPGWQSWGHTKNTAPYW
ncbi:protein phosphatase 1, regulatory subunit 3Ca isoform X2 [Chanos chanos]|uniref:Protein phosphatase 1 regulatory subunit 3C n=1 Tax=Chanos chanos TaxID=29144 RepID=A0A6J2WC63_CHACN|nr:protein phosphatase 1 regulatory subunit 3C-B-like isoform X2 [Chanos chanos]